MVGFSKFTALSLVFDDSFLSFDTQEQIKILMLEELSETIHFLNVTFLFLQRVDLHTTSTTKWGFILWWVGIMGIKK